MNIHKLASRMRRMQQRKAAEENVTPTARLVRERSLNEQATPPRMRGYYTIHCVHDVHKFFACRACKRTRRDGEANMKRFVAAALKTA